MKKAKRKLCGITLVILLITPSFSVYGEELKSENTSIVITTESNPQRYTAYQVFEYTNNRVIEYDKFRCKYTADCMKRWYVGKEGKILLDEHKKDYNSKVYYLCRGCPHHFYTNEDWDNHCITAMDLNGIFNPCVNQSFDVEYPPTNTEHANAVIEEKKVTAEVPNGSYYIFKDSEWFKRVKEYYDNNKDSCGFTFTPYNDGDLYVIDISAATDSQKESFYQYLYDYIPIEAEKHSIENTSSTVKIDNLDSGMYLVISYDENIPTSKDQKYPGAKKDHVGVVWLDTGNTKSVDNTTSETQKEEGQIGSSSPITPDGSQLEEWMPPINMIIVSDANVIDGNGNILGTISKGSDIGVSGQCLGYYQVNYGAKRSFLPKSVLANH